jgi:DNA-binding CsgD family transcriptional regulator
MFVLVVSPLSATRHATAATIQYFEPEARILSAADLVEAQCLLETGRIAMAWLDPHLVREAGLARVELLRRRFPGVRLLEPGAGEPAPRPAADNPLTPRQTEVLSLLREGRSTKEIARNLGLSVPTVKTHLAALYRQLGARNRVDAAMAPVARPLGMALHA